MQKKGELTSSEIVYTILIIIGFIIVLVFLTLFIDPLGEQSEDEICRLSILTRATSPDATQRLFPLKCQTGKICLTTERNGVCEQFIGEDSNKVQLSGTNQQIADKIEEIIANEHFDCWSITGKGRLDIANDGTFVDENLIKSFSSFLNQNKKGATCLICTRIAIADDLKTKPEILSLIDVNDYMATKQVPGTTKTYLQTFTDTQITSLPGEIIADYNDQNLKKPPTNEIAIIFAQIRAEGSLLDEFGTGALASGSFIVGGSYALGATGSLIKTISTTPLGAVASLIATVGTGGIKAYGKYQHQEIAQAYCGQFTSAGKELRYGCSVVTQADYNNIPSINQLCSGGIEGKP